MPLIPVDLGGGRKAHIREETPYGEIEDARWLENTGSSSHPTTPRTRGKRCASRWCASTSGRGCRRGGHGPTSSPR